MTREVICCDAVEWLTSREDGSLGHIITSFPDMNEVGLDKEEYRTWVTRVVTLCFLKCNPKSYILFCQTDRKVKGEWFDKSSVVVEAARTMQMPLRWHKIVLRKTHVDLLRPTYSHMLCFSRKSGPGKGTVDVIHGGKSIYAHGMPIGAAKYMCEFLAAFGDRSTTQVIDPFVGRGTTLAVAEMYGFHTIGIDCESKQCEYAKNLTCEDVTAILNAVPNAVK